jgi:hypothetical protein
MGGPRHSQEESEFFPASQRIGDRLAQAGVRFYFPFLELGPSSQFHPTGTLIGEFSGREPLSWKGPAFSDKWLEQHFVVSNVNAD